MAYEAILYDRHEHVAIVTLNRPDRLNAISQALREEVHAAVQAAQDDDEVRALIVTGAGDRGFCSGADLSGGAEARARAAAAAADQNQTQRLDQIGWVGRWARRFFYFDKPMIAAVNGIAAGAGMSMAMAADLRVGSEHSRFKSVFIERNFSPDSGLSYFLPRVIGYSRAADLIFTSRTVLAEEAYRLGLLDRLVPHASLVEEAVKVAGEMTGWPPLALRMSKRVLQHNFEADFEDAIRYETVGLGLSRKAVNDQRESLLAFTEKRKPKYTGA
ncbi:MAG TPA: enoyl-CoA hydratase/isomerase family protein [Caulobacteraceae bacterium]|jgi:2-(1,2-epoxy-1,2-dihydrophenyl)acetyl-CoA isomerase|nr:enoyl-CoA hydratase/isomerase family protein [Caulobacteraceae bacterium]